MRESGKALGKECDELTALRARISELEHQILRSRSILRDVSDRQETAEALKMSEALVRAMFDSALDAIIGMDDQGLVIDFNRAAETIFGLRREEAVGKPLVELIVPPSLRANAESGTRVTCTIGTADPTG